MIVDNKKYLTSILLLVPSFFYMSAQSDMPPPPTRHAPGPPGLPIDDGIVFLVIAALVFGIYVILKFHKKSKQA